jgi:hypothetical protein
MKRSLALSLIGLVTVIAISCSKHSSGPSAGYGPNSLFPTTNGDTWYFEDSAFNDTALITAYPDTMVATKNPYTDPTTGLVFLEMNNPYGWFDGSYIAVDPTNDIVYEADSISGYQSYIFFALVTADGPIGPSSVDYSNPACPITYTQYGYAAELQEYGYPCYENTELVQDCHSIILEQTNSWVSPGVGVVRIEDYLTDTVGGVNKFYEDYSQTLTGKTLH